MTRYVRIVLVDRDDYSRVFSNEPYPLRAVVPMWVRPYTTVMKLHALDADYVKVEYQIESGQCSVFLSNVTPPPPLTPSTQDA